MHKYIPALMLLAVLITLVKLPGCSRKPDSADNKREGDQQFVLSSDGHRITLHQSQIGVFKTITVKKKSVTIYLKLAARTIAEILPYSNAGKPILIFETQDISQIYSDYLKNKAAYTRSAKQLERTRELYENKAASGKDVLDAETETKQNEAAANDSEGRLRQTGFNLKLLGL